MASAEISPNTGADENLSLTQDEWENAILPDAAPDGNDLLAFLNGTEAGSFLQSDGFPPGEIDIVSLLSDEPSPDEEAAARLSPFSAGSSISAASPISSLGETVSPGSIGCGGSPESVLSGVSSENINVGGSSPTYTLNESSPAAFSTFDGGSSSGSAVLGGNNSGSADLLRTGTEQDVAANGPASLSCQGFGPILSDSDLAFLQSLPSLTSDRQPQADGYDDQGSKASAVNPLPLQSTSGDVAINMDLAAELGDDPGIFDCDMGMQDGAVDDSQPNLVLTEEEKQLLAQDGVELPTDLPLTKAEEKALKRVRRKIKNKVSAQDSRRRKKEYVEGLEGRVKASTSSNQRLQRRVRLLEDTNKNLIQHLQRLQAIVTAIYPAKPAQTGVAVLVLSFAFFLIPGFSPGGTAVDVSVAYAGGSVRTRTLLAPEISVGRMEDPPAAPNRQLQKKEDDSEKEAVLGEIHPKNQGQEGADSSSRQTRKWENAPGHRNHAHHKHTVRLRDET